MFERLNLSDNELSVFGFDQALATEVGERMAYDLSTGSDQIGHLLVAKSDLKADAVAASHSVVVTKLEQQVG